MSKYCEYHTVDANHLSSSIEHCISQIIVFFSLKPRTSLLSNPEKYFLAKEKHVFYS